MNWQALLAEWSIAEPWSIRAMPGGINNLSQIVETPSGSYVLRTYPSDRAPEHIRYELTVLSELRQQDLPFHVPAPLPTISGELFAEVNGTSVTLTPLLSGSMPQNGDLDQASFAGRALAELGKTLAAIHVRTTAQVAPFPPSGEFDGWAGVPIEPEPLIRQLPLSKRAQEHALSFLEGSLAAAPALYRALPQQIIHRDYDQSNILMQGNRVSAILDFEFCGYDLRVLDLVYALSQWPSGFWNTGREWEIMDSFAKGYLQRQTLTLAELESLPRLLRLRATTSLFFRLGRYTRGVDLQAGLIERMEEIAVGETWLKQNEEELLRRARNWYHEAQ